MANKNFIKTFDSVTATIAFNPNWKNGTGYFDNAVKGIHMADVPTGLTVKCVDDAGRRMLITGITGQAEDGDMNGKHVSNVIIFERFTDGENGVVVSNASLALRKKYDFLGNGNISDESFSKFHAR